MPRSAVPTPAGFHQRDAAPVSQMSASRPEVAFWAVRLRSWLVLMPALLAACASAPQRVPSDFDLARARIEPAAEPARVMPRAGSKPAGAVQGAAVGAVTTGLFAGLITAVPCVFMGFLAGPCFATVVPAAAATGLAAGAAGGAVVGAKDSDSAEVAQAKRTLLEFAVATLPLRERLVTHLQRQARESAGVDLPVAPAGALELSAWRIGIGVLVIDADAGKEGPYRLRATSGLTVTRAGEERPAFSKRYEVATPGALATGEWQSDGAAAARAALDDLMASLAAAMLAELRQVQVGSKDTR